MVYQLMQMPLYRLKLLKANLVFQIQITKTLINLTFFNIQAIEIDQLKILVIKQIELDLNLVQVLNI